MLFCFFLGVTLENEAIPAVRSEPNDPLSRSLIFTLSRSLTNTHSLLFLSRLFSCSLYSDTVRHEIIFTAIVCVMSSILTKEMLCKSISSLIFISWTISFNFTCFLSLPLCFNISFKPFFSYSTFLFYSFSLFYLSVSLSLCVSLSLSLTSFALLFTYSSLFPSVYISLFLSLLFVSFPVSAFLL